MIGGTALGAAAAGELIQRIGIEVALVAPCLALALATLVGAARRRNLDGAAVARA
jgi:hypothetical protein